jgi:hypothetical protein
MGIKILLERDLDFRVLSTSAFTLITGVGQTGCASSRGKELGSLVFG